MDAEQRDLLLSVSYAYLACGMERRALPLLLLLVAADDGKDAAALRGLAHAYVATGRGDEALGVLDLLERHEAGVAGPAPGLLLLRSRALHQQGRHGEARACFGAFVALRRAGQPAEAGS